MMQLSPSDLPSSRLSFDVLPPINLSNSSSSSQELAALLNVTATDDDYNFSCRGSEFGSIDDIGDCLYVQFGVISSSSARLPYT